MKNNPLNKKHSKTPTTFVLCVASIFLLSSCGALNVGGSSISQSSKQEESNRESLSSVESKGGVSSIAQQASSSQQLSSKEAEPSVVDEDSKSSEVGHDSKSSESSNYIAAGQKATEKCVYKDANGDIAYIPKDFMVSSVAGEGTINTGLVVIGPDGSEFVWVPTTVTPLEVRDFGSYFSGGDSIDSYYDETTLFDYQAMVASTSSYGGFYIGRYEASKGSDNLPKSVRVSSSEPGQIWVQFSPADTSLACQSLYTDNNTVVGFFPWGINWDTTLQWLVDSGNKSYEQVSSNSTSWGNYSNDTFSTGANGRYTGIWEEAKSNNIYDLAGNNWEWTQERKGTNYVMRGGGYNLMGGACPGDRYPAALRDPLPGNNHHPNVCFRIGLYVN